LNTDAKPHAPACDRNRDPILAVLRQYFADRSSVLEIGSGTGQHAVYFAASLSWLSWQVSDQAERLPGIRQWLDEAALDNTPPPIALDVNAVWPRQRFDAVFSANTLHIMSWGDVEKMFSGLRRVLAAHAIVVVYGPFNYSGQFTSDSNAAFDASLRLKSVHMGIRDFEAVDTLAREVGLTLVEDRAMPANNRTLIWRRTEAHGPACR
jgi:cyclopropane fatty-acyl-phospholipid synthase-like methyltransferase